jgi:ankyrin repeat protein
LAEEFWADVDHAMRDGATPLLIASESGHLDVVRYLVRLGADVNKANNEDITPLMAASVRKHKNVVAWLTKELHAIAEANEAAIIKASNSYDVPELRRLGDQGLRTTTAEPLYIAVAGGHLDMVRVLIEELGAGVNQLDDLGVTHIIRAIQRGRLDVVKCLCEEFKADVNRALSDWVTPLSVAACHGHLAIVQYLIEELGVHVQEGENIGCLALVTAAHFGHLDVVLYFIKKLGTDVIQADVLGVTPFSAATDGRQYRVLLLLTTMHIEAWRLDFKVGVERFWSLGKEYSFAAVNWICSIWSLFGSVATVVTMLALSASVMWMHFRDLDAKVVRTHLVQDLDAARLELNLQKEVAAKSSKIQGQRQQAAVDILKWQHVAALKEQSKDAANSRQASYEKATVEQNRMQKVAAMALKEQRRLTAAALKGQQEAVAALDRQKKEFMKAQQRLKDDTTGQTQRC